MSHCDCADCQKLRADNKRLTEVNQRLTQRVKDLLLKMLESNRTG